METFPTPYCLLLVRYFVAQQAEPQQDPPSQQESPAFALRLACTAPATTTSASKAPNNTFFILDMIILLYEFDEM